MYISIKVITNAAKNEVLEQGKNMFLIKVTASPDRGKANKRVLELLADYFNVAKSAIAIVKGKYTSKKIIHITPSKSGGA